jgi:hypothetical protein
MSKYYFKFPNLFFICGKMLSNLGNSNNGEKAVVTFSYWPAGVVGQRRNGEEWAYVMLTAAESFSLHQHRRRRKA